MKKLLLIAFFLQIVLLRMMASVSHPFIWVTQEEHQTILDKIENYSWARSVVNVLYKRVDTKKAAYESNPAAQLSSIPALGDTKTTHSSTLQLAAEAGMLYYITQDESYGKMAATIVNHYCKLLENLTPQTTYIEGGHGAHDSHDEAFYNARGCYNNLALAYDFAYNYMYGDNAEVYDLADGKFEKFDTSAGQKAMKNIVGNMLKEYGRADTHGSVVSNHPILTAPPCLFAILCIDDDTERERLFNVFWNSGTKEQPSFLHTILPMFNRYGQGIWPESVSYGFMPNVPLVINLIDAS